ncbi:AP2 domain-containing protein [Paenibacillus anaericanus]|uniref:AP2 domain-containing protein n=1 Tax=Paenibacillus anaericanus TaxID=170367 RepID=A0A433XVX6_9BACL|nr:AP2 domain-containing protein [Paenibacillus anaericanus]RUT38706.1 AP2 domain-containing protein [Paenibacillus anaericanus]
MSKKLNLVGQRFGRLTVIAELPKEGSSPRWSCICDCGNPKVATTIVLRRGDCKSCGCLHRDYLTDRHAKTDTDISGKRFGKLVALYKVKVENKKSIMWLCQCDCGQTIPIPASEMKKGKIRSCGCLISDHVTSWFEAGTNIPALLANNISSRNTSGTKGVHFDPSRNKWCAEIMFQRKRYRLGRYDDKQEAIQIRKEAENQLHGDFLDWYNNRQ